jgi:hypothetical protein
MSVLTPGYILEISDTDLLVNGFSMPFSGKVEAAIGAVFEQLSQLTLSGGAPGGLGIVIKDTRAGGLGEVSRTVPPGQPVTLSMFAPAAPPAAAVQSAAAPTPAPVIAPAPVLASPAAPEPAIPSVLSPFERLAQGQVVPARADSAPVAAFEAPPVRVDRPQAPQAATPQVEVRTEPPAPVLTAAPVTVPTDQSQPPLSTPDAGVDGLEPAADEIDFESIFKDDEPIVDEGIRTPIGQSLTARQRTEGFSLKSNARIAIERRRERKRKLIYSTVGVITVLAALRIVGAVMAGPSGDFAAICVDARTMQRLTTVSCTTNANPFAQTVYFAVGQNVPAVGGKAMGGTVEKPSDPRAINTDVAEGRDGVVLEGGEVK